MHKREQKEESTMSQGENMQYVIVIGRQYGSGGRRIGKMIANQLGISYYDKTLLSEAAAKLGYSPEIFATKDEKRPSLFRSLLSFTYGAQTANIDQAPMSDEKLYEYQSQVIRDICEKESCVIVGRTADYVMRSYPNMVSLFIHAPIETRIKAIIKRGEASTEKEAEEIADKNDRGREAYYNYYTNRNLWGKAQNYHLSFDSTRISDKAIIAAIQSLLGFDRNDYFD